MGKGATLLATGMFALSTVMALVGVATTDWIKTDAVVIYKGTKYESVVSAQGFITDSECRVGLWEICCTDFEANKCVTRTRVVEDWLQAVRILMVVSVAMLGLVVILLLCYSFKTSAYDSNTFTQCMRFCLSLSVVLMLMLVLAYGMLEYTKEDGLFQGASGAAFGWSFYLFLAASLLNGVATFLGCSEWHFNEDAEAGILSVDYDEYDQTKKAMRNY